ncbi:MAG: NAD(P)H-hydrate dehydratase [Bacteroidota bacterium]
MQILSAAQTRELDQLTIECQQLAAAELMERAGERLFTALSAHTSVRQDIPIYLLCGSGNNGGDGLVLARLLQEAGYAITVWHALVGTPTEENQLNAERFQAFSGANYQTISSDAPYPTFTTAEVILIDALFGAGLSRPIAGYWAGLVEQFNQQSAFTVAIDLPSGVPGEGSVAGAAIQADWTICIELPKLSVFLVDNAAFIGEWTTVSIDLDQEALRDIEPLAILAEPYLLQPLLRRRGTFDHKGTFGHAAIIAGSYGKMGACLLAARAALRAGAGLVTTHIPGCGYQIMQMAFPEAMCVVDEHQYLISQVGEIDKYQALGVGPGLGQNILTENALADLLQRAERPLVLDADALNILAKRQDLWSLIPPNSILTPHPKEFDRLFGPFDSYFRRSERSGDPRRSGWERSGYPRPSGWSRLQQMSRELNCIVVLKGGYSFISSPDQPLWINPTGNPGMGTGGAGDVLTGILTGLLAQGYPPYDAARLGVYLHGLAGDLAAEEEEQEAVIASDLVEYLGKAFGRLRAAS